MGLKAEQNKTQFSLKDDSPVRSQAIQDLGTKAAKSPHPKGHTNGSRDTHKNEVKSMCVHVCVMEGGCS